MAGEVCGDTSYDRSAHDRELDVLRELHARTNAAHGGDA